MCSIVAEFLLGGAVWSWPSFCAGWVLALVSFGLRTRAIAALGPFWSLHIEIRQQHEFVRTGPFRWVRHPAYLSMLLELVAGPLIMSAFFSLWIVPVFFLPILIWRVRSEEAAMVEKFGEAYRIYQRTTPALFPYKRPGPIAPAPSPAGEVARIDPE